MNIAIDLDKTLFNCNSFIYNIYNKLQAYKKFNKKLVYKTVLNTNEKNIGFLKFFSRAFNPDKYNEIENAISIIKNLKADGNNITLLSSRPYNIKAVKNSAIAWLNKNNVPYDSLVLGCKNKGYFCKMFNMNLLIDDTLTNCISACSNGVPAICLTKKQICKNEILNKFENGLFFANNWKTVNLISAIINKKLFDKSKNVYSEVAKKRCNDSHTLNLNASYNSVRNIMFNNAYKTKEFKVNKNNSAKSSPTK